MGAGPAVRVATPSPTPRASKNPLSADVVLAVVVMSQHPTAGAPSYLDAATNSPGWLRLTSSPLRASACLQATRLGVHRSAAATAPGLGFDREGPSVNIHLPERARCG